MVLAGSVGPAGSDPGRRPDRPEATSCSPAWSTLTTPNASATNWLYGIDGASTADIWAVGDWVDTDELVHTLVQHWDGASWTIVPSPNVADRDNSLVGVAAVSASTAWAVGSFIDADETRSTLIQKWNGSSWSLVPSPNIGTDTDLYGISARSASDIWAVGTYADPAEGRSKSLVLHRDGSSWSITSSPNAGSGDNALKGVATRTSSDAWAVGYSVNPSTGHASTLAQRWNGTAWNVVATPNPSPSADNVLTAVATVSAEDAWAVGYQTGGGPSHTMAMHWNGTAWSVVSTPKPGTIGDSLYGVAAVTGGDVWTMGTFDLDGVRQPLMLHWDGSVWRQATTPEVGSQNSAFINNALAGATVIEGQVWSAGYDFVDGVGIRTLAERLCPVSVLDSGFSPTSVTFDHGQTEAWSFPSSNAQSHSIKDDSGLGLFVSGTRAPGTSYTFDLIASGSFPILDTVTSKTGTLKTRPTVDPPAGGTGTTYTVEWSSAQAPSGYVFDTQIKRPGSTWVNWKTNKTGTQATFTPDAGAGTYSFRSRMRATVGGAASGWSPSVSIQVS